jgi:hypothetical protein
MKASSKIAAGHPFIMAASKKSYFKATRRSPKEIKGLPQNFELPRRNGIKFASKTIE